jgi:hypothetical protein
MRFAKKARACGDSELNSPKTKSELLAHQFPSGPLRNNLPKPSVITAPWKITDMIRILELGGVNRPNLLAKENPS